MFFTTMICCFPQFGSLRCSDFSFLRWNRGSEHLWCQAVWSSRMTWMWITWIPGAVGGKPSAWRHDDYRIYTNVKRKCKIMCQFMFYFENFLRIGCLTALKGVGNWNAIQGWGWFGVVAMFNGKCKAALDATWMDGLTTIIVTCACSGCLPKRRCIAFLISLFCLSYVLCVFLKSFQKRLQIPRRVARSGVSTWMKSTNQQRWRQWCETVYCAWQHVVQHVAKPFCTHGKNREHKELQLQKSKEFYGKD